MENKTGIMRLSVKANNEQSTMVKYHMNNPDTQNINSHRLSDWDRHALYWKKSNSNSIIILARARGTMYMQRIYINMLITQ